MTQGQVINLIKSWEGFEEEPYLDPDPPKDPENPTYSIFHGHQIRPGESVLDLKHIGPDTVAANDVTECAHDVVEILTEKVGVSEGKAFEKRWKSDSLTRCDLSIIDMRFQLGPAGLRGFRKMWNCWKNGDWPGVRREATDSKWYRDLLKWGSTRGQGDVKLLLAPHEEWK